MEMGKTVHENIKISNWGRRPESTLAVLETINFGLFIGVRTKKGR
jgi:hypothetical protein